MTYNDRVEMEKFPYALAIGSLIGFVIGSLMYALVCICSNITLVVNALRRYLSGLVWVIVKSLKGL